MEKIIFLLLESSFIYCCFWIAYLVLFVTMGQSRPLSAFAVYNAAFHDISGIYPTSLILAVALQRSTAPTTAREARGQQQHENSVLQYHEDPDLLQSASQSVPSSSHDSLMEARSRASTEEIVMVARDPTVSGALQQ